MPIAVGGANITDIRIGSTLINRVYVGAQLVWARLTLGASPATNVTALNDLNTSPFGTATATATVSTIPSTSVTFSFTQISGSTASTGTTSGTTTSVSISRPASAGAGTTTSVVRVTASIGGSPVSSKTITLNALQDFV